jgi:predicted AlkP superfamily pyrophosphatase or phosphodiesterase
MIGEHTPCISRILGGSEPVALSGVIPAVTCTAQATMLTGLLPSEHGVVGNGWLYRDTMEVRLWQQARTLIQGETVYDAARRQFPGFTCAKLFWWFNQGAAVDWSVTPKPWYGADGNKVFGIHGNSDEFVKSLEDDLGKFPFHTFWGPEAGIPCTEWIAKATANVLHDKRPTLTMTYLPHLDYDLQRHGASWESAGERVRELDNCIAIIERAASDVGAGIVIVSEYGIADVHKPVHINTVLRNKGFLKARSGPFGESIDLFNSRAFAVVDHQLAHVYVKSSSDLKEVKTILCGIGGVDMVLDSEGKKEFGLDHPRSGELVAIADKGAWFTYYYWLHDDNAPDFARTVDIHRKPGYDPCELFYDPEISYPRGRAVLRLIQKRFGFRTLFDVVSLDANLVKGSHGRLPADPADGPVFISSGEPVPDGFAMTAIKDYLLKLISG